MGLKPYAHFHCQKNICPNRRLSIQFTVGNQEAMSAPVVHAVQVQTETYEPTTPKKDKRLSHGAIGGIAGGSAAALGVAIAWTCYRRKHKAFVLSTYQHSPAASLKESPTFTPKAIFSKSDSDSHTPDNASFQDVRRRLSDAFNEEDVDPALKNVQRKLNFGDELNV